MSTIIISAAGSSSPSFFKSLARPVIVSAVFFMLLAGVAYPLATTGVGVALFPDQAQGSLVVKDGKVAGSRLIGQHFTGPEYFHGRPSATMGAAPDDPSRAAAQPYNAAAGAASNQGVLSRQLRDAVAERTLAYRKMNGLAADALVPVDAVTASASGLDPHISVANAQLQAPRVARARGVPVEQVRLLMDRYTSPRHLGVLGDPRVHVLELNLALDLAVPARPEAR